MSASTEGEDRTRLDGFELEIFRLVREQATSEQWREWLRAPLEHAAADGNMDLFTRLMDAGADGSEGWRGCHGRTLLAAAAHGKSKNMVVALLKAGAKDDVNVTFGAREESALYVAALQSATEASRVLMAAGADPNLLGGGFNLRTPLQVAAREGHDGVVGMLLLKGALPNTKTVLGEETALHLAASRGYTMCVSELLLAGADKDSRDGDGSTPLIMAARYNRLGAVEELLAAGADVDIRDESDWSSLHDTARRGYVNVVRALLRHGSSVEATDDGGFTALHIAADVSGPHRDNGDTIRVLLEAGADIEANTDYGYTPLHVAANGRIASSGTIHAVLEGGANINARDPSGNTPLHTACSRSCVGDVELLLRWGADEMLLNQWGDTPANRLKNWDDDAYFSDDDDDDENEERLADNQHIRHILARAPADRAWRRRSWLVLARCCPTKVQLANVSNSSGNNGSCTKIARRARVDGSGGGGNGTAKTKLIELQRLVGRVVGLGTEGVFRLVVGFL